MDDLSFGVLSLSVRTHTELALDLYDYAGIWCVGPKTENAVLLLSGMLPEHVAIERLGYFPAFLCTNTLLSLFHQNIYVCMSFVRACMIYICT